MLGEDHPRTLASRNNLAYSYLLTGRTGEAITHFEQVVNDCIRILGEDHSYTMAALENLATARQELAEQVDSSSTEEHEED